MSKKLNSSGYPRKFTDKIALIKQKEALTNACFESAIQGLSDISMKRVTSVDDNNFFDIKNKIYPNENISKLKDEFSNTSYSPQSFTSDSTITNPLSNENYQLKEPNNDVFKGYYENRNLETGSFQNLPSCGAIKFRHGSEKSASQFNQTRLSNIEGYPSLNPLNRDLNEQLCSGSLPDVSSFNDQNYLKSRSSFNSERLSSPSKQYSEIYSQINLKEALSNLEQVKKETISKKALFEHLKNRGLQSHTGSHPHHVVTTEAPINLVSILSSPSINRNRVGYTHTHDSSVCAANTSENGHLKHYLSSNSPYLSLPGRDLSCNKDCDNLYRKRHVSGNVISPHNHMELNLNCKSDLNNDVFKCKSLTPTETVQHGLFNTPNENHLLSPVVYDVISADYRRVASDSSIQKSLKHYSNISPNNFSFKNEENNFARIRNNRLDPTTIIYPRIKSMTSEQTNNFPDSFMENQKNFNYQRENSSLSSFLENYLSPNSPDENLDPNLDVPVAQNKLLRQSFKFSELNKLSEELHIKNTNRCSCSNDEIDASQMDVTNEFCNTVCDVSETTSGRQNCNFSEMNGQLPDQNDQCYWTQPTGSNQFNYSKEPSPIIKPCENLDPQNIALDLNTDFSCIPDITLNDEDTQRRDSLNMADEVLSNLNMDPNGSEFNLFKDKLFGFSFYPPMDSLSEEASVKNFENEY